MDSYLSQEYLGIRKCNQPNWNSNSTGILLILIKPLVGKFGDITIMSSIPGPGRTNTDSLKTTNNDCTALNKNETSYLPLDMVKGTRTTYTGRLNNGLSFKFSEGYPARQTPEEDRRTHRPKHCHNNKDEEEMVRM